MTEFVSNLNNRLYETPVSKYETPVSKCILLHTKWVIALNATNGDYNPTARHYQNELKKTLNELTNSIDDNNNIYTILKIPLFAKFNDKNTRIEKIFFPQPDSIEKFFKKFIGDYIITCSNEYAGNIKNPEPKYKYDAIILPSVLENKNINITDDFMHERLTLYTILLNEDIRQFYNKYIICEKFKTKIEFKLYVKPIIANCSLLSKQIKGDNVEETKDAGVEQIICNNSVIYPDLESISNFYKHTNKTDQNFEFNEYSFTDDACIDAVDPNNPNTHNPDCVADYEYHDHYYEPHNLETPDNFHTNTVGLYRSVRTTFKIPLKVVFPKVAEQFFDDNAGSSSPHGISNSISKQRLTIQDRYVQTKKLLKGGQRTRKLYKVRSSSSSQLTNNMSVKSKRNRKRTQPPKINNKKNKQ